MQARTVCAGCLALALFSAGCDNSKSVPPPDVAALPAVPRMTEPAAAPVSPPSASEPVLPDPAASEPTPPEPAAPQAGAPQAGAPQAGAPQAGAPAAPAMAAKPQVPSSLFSATRDEDIMGTVVLGDVDGDGLDDFFIIAMLPFEEIEAQFRPLGPDSHMYLFYGRANFPARLSTDDADAMFVSILGGGAPLGDVNGDGCADIGIPRRDGLEIVFGSRERLRGKIAEGSKGSVRWTLPPLPEAIRALTGQVFMEVYALGIGDFNADGFDDMSVLATRILDPLASIFNPGEAITMSAYLVLGHGGEWRSAEWDPSWAAARFGEQHVPDDPVTGQQAYDYPLMPMRAGDLDKDGRADLMAQGSAKTFLFYGGRTLSGIVGTAQADATIAHEMQHYVMEIGDADGDGAADIMIPTQENLLQVMYGRRWSGVVTLEPDLTIDVNSLANGGGYGAAGDIDGDGSPEIVVAVPTAGQDFSSSIARPPTGALFVLRGTGTRAVGTHRLGEESLLMRGPLAGGRGQHTVEAGIGMTLSMTGDINGDGAFDILTSAPGAIVSAQALGAVFLIPSTRKTAR